MFQCKRRGSYQNNHHKTIFLIEHYSRVLISYKFLLEVYQKNDYSFFFLSEPQMIYQIIVSEKNYENKHTKVFFTHQELF